MINSDPKLKKLLVELRERPELPYRKLVRQVIDLHATIPTAKNPTGSELSRSRLKASADRSRIAGMKLQCLREMMYLNDVEVRMRDYLQAKYANFLQGYRNKSARDAVLADALAPIVSRTRPIKSVLEIIDVALTDYDSKGFALRDAGAAMAIGERDL